MQIRVCSKERNQGNEWSSFFFSVLRCLARSKLQHSFTRATHFISNLFFYQFVIPLLLPPFPTPFKISFTYSSRGVSSLKIKQLSTHRRINIQTRRPTLFTTSRRLRAMRAENLYAMRSILPTSTVFHATF